jgi:hypothetical protein
MIRNPYTIALAMEKRPVTASTTSTTSNQHATTGLLHRTSEGQESSVLLSDDDTAVMPLSDSGFSTIRATNSTSLRTSATQVCAIEH